ncbi:hypothetical protein [Pseudohalocynthiibacter sp. F2068]|jgi:LexA-binding, inner membrane-associated putative hydrolase|uniref:metal-dependent hydrolase n=1 Tax=Pseudohalocynthiibacter sp. F2068 TaxID=2926418 RepID=UPI001FF6E4A5|nr:hypothetical protein [Pseudohalocynthiibacter sp. F2068]MCK0101321.1 hypothetical protein [Pseudohalocynthiibacter sp. F2068]
MQAINHAVTALILKKTFPEAPLLGLILTTEAVEYLWVGLNIVGLEKTDIGPEMQSVSDVHLVHMPFSHSVGTSVILAAVLGLIVFWHGGKAAKAIALALSLGVFSHIVLDLIVHAPDIAVFPFFNPSKLGTGLYTNQPLLALALETVWGILCWWIFRGSWGLLALIVTLEITALPLYSNMINAGESLLTGQDTIFALVILAQMIATTALVWLFARKRTEAQPNGNAAVIE